MPQRRKSADMRLMSIEDQLETQQRLATRREATEAIKRMEAALRAFLDNDDAKFKALIASFQASGHQGQYHESPSETAKRQQLAAEVEKLVRETPLNWMSALELSYNVRRIDAITEILHSLAPGDATIKEILKIYRGIGDNIRQIISTETGHLPEEFPVPRDRIRGDEPDSLFKLADYQPKLFDN